MNLLDSGFNNVKAHNLPPNLVSQYCNREAMSSAEISRPFALTALLADRRRMC